MLLYISCISNTFLFTSSLNNIQEAWNEGARSRLEPEISFLLLLCAMFFSGNFNGRPKFECQLSS